MDPRLGAVAGREKGSGPIPPLNGSNSTTAANRSKGIARHRQHLVPLVQIKEPPAGRPSSPRAEYSRRQDPRGA
jgi:hypothetical protein